MWTKHTSIAPSLPCCNDTKIKSSPNILDKKRVYMWLTGYEKFLCKAPRNIFVHSSKKRRRHDTILTSLLVYPTSFALLTFFSGLTCTPFSLSLAERLPGKDTIEFTTCTSNRINDEKNEKHYSVMCATTVRFWQVRKWIFVAHEDVVQLHTITVKPFSSESEIRFWRDTVTRDAWRRIASTLCAQLQSHHCSFNFIVQCSWLGPFSRRFRLKVRRHYLPIVAV